MPPALRSAAASRRRRRSFPRILFLVLGLSYFILTFYEVCWSSFLTTPSNAASLLDARVPDLYCDGSELILSGISLAVGNWYSIRNCTIPNDHSPFVIIFPQINIGTTSTTSSTSSPADDSSLTAFSISSSRFRSHLYFTLPTQQPMDDSSSSVNSQTYRIRIEVTSCLFTGGANIIFFEGTFPAGSTLSIHANTFLWSKNQLNVQNAVGLYDRRVSGIVFFNPTLSFRLAHSTIEVTHNNMSVSINNATPADPNAAVSDFETAFIFMCYASISMRLNSTVRFDGNHLVGGVGQHAVTVHLQATELEDGNSSIHVSEQSTLSASENTFQFALTTEIMSAFVVAIRSVKGSFVLSGSGSYVLMSNNAFDSKRGVADCTPIFVDGDSSIREASVVSISISDTLSIENGGVMNNSDNVWLSEPEPAASDNPPVLTTIAVTNAFRLFAREITLMGRGSAWVACGNSIRGPGTNMRQIFAVRLIVGLHFRIMQSSILNVSFNSVDDVFYASRSPSTSVGNQHEDPLQNRQITAVQIETNPDASSAHGQISISLSSLLSMKSNLIGLAVPCCILNNTITTTSFGDVVDVDPAVLHVVYIKASTMLEMMNSRAEIENNSIVVRRGSAENANTDGQGECLAFNRTNTSTVGLDIANGSSVVFVEAGSTITLTSSSFMRLTKNNADFTYSVPRNLRASSYYYPPSSEVGDNKYQRFACSNDPLEAPFMQSGVLAVGSFVRAIDFRALGNNTNDLLRLVNSVLEISHNTLRGFRNGSRDLSSVSIEAFGGVHMDLGAELQVHRNLISCVYGRAWRVSAVYFALLSVCGSANSCGNEEDFLLVDGGSSLAITGNAVTGNLIGAYFAAVLINVSTRSIRVRGTSYTGSDSPSTVVIGNNSVVCDSNAMTNDPQESVRLLGQTDTLHAVLVVANGLRIEDGALVSVADNSLRGHLLTCSSSSPPPPRSFMYPRAVGLYINASAYRTHGASFPYADVSTLRGGRGGDSTVVGSGLAVVGGGGFMAIGNTIQLVNGTNVVAFLLNASFVFVSGSPSPSPSRFVVSGNAVVDTYTTGGQAVVAMETLVLWVERGASVEVATNTMRADLLVADGGVMRIPKARAVVLCASRVAVEGINTELILSRNALTLISADDSTVVYLTPYTRRSLSWLVPALPAPTASEERRIVTVSSGAVLWVEENAAADVVGDRLSVVQLFSPGVGLPVTVDGNGTSVMINANRAIRPVGNDSAVVRLPAMHSLRVASGATLAISDNLGVSPSPLTSATFDNASAGPLPAHAFVVVSIEHVQVLSVGLSGVLSISSNALHEMGPKREINGVDDTAWAKVRAAYARVSLFASVRLTVRSDGFLGGQSVLSITDNTVSSSLGSSSSPPPPFATLIASGTVLLRFGSMDASSSSRINISRNRLNNHTGDGCFTVRLSVERGLWLSSVRGPPQLLLERNTAESIVGDHVVAVFVESNLESIELHTGSLLSVSFNTVRGVVGTAARAVFVYIKRFSNYGTASFNGNRLSDCSQAATFIDIGDVKNPTRYSEKGNFFGTLHESTVAVARFVALALFVTDEFEAVDGFSGGPIALRLSSNSVVNVTGLSISAVLFVVSGQSVPQLSIRGKLVIAANSVQKAVGLQIRAVFLLCGFFPSVASAGDPFDLSAAGSLTEIDTNFTLRVVSESSLTVTENMVVDAFANTVEVVSLMLAKEEDTKNNNDDNTSAPLSLPRFGSICLGEPGSSTADLSLTLNFVRNVTAKRVVAALIVADGIGVRSGFLFLSFNEVNTIFTIPSDQCLLGSTADVGDQCTLNNKTSANRTISIASGAVTVMAVCVSVNRILRLDNSYTCCGRSGQDSAYSVGRDVGGSGGLIMCGKDADDDPPSFFSPADNPRFSALNNRVEDVHGIDLITRAATLGFLTVSNASLLLGKSSLYLAACTSSATSHGHQLVVPSPLWAHRSLGTLTVADHEHSRLASLLENLKGGQSSETFYLYFTNSPTGRLPALWSGYNFVAVGNRTTGQAACLRSDTYRSESSTVMSSSCAFPGLEPLVLSCLATIRGG